MRIALGNDHAGVEAKKAILEALGKKNHEILDFGTNEAESVDYPDFAEKVAKAVVEGECDRGILVCGTGIGMAIAANKVRGIRAAPCHNEYTVQMSRAHNDANILCLGARILSVEQAVSLALLWLTLPFDGGHHEIRVSKIKAIEGS